MIITFDLGNTDLTFGVFDKNKLVAVFRTASDRHKSVDEFSAAIKTLLLSKGIEIERITGSILCSVVTELTKIVFQAIKRILPEPLLLGPGVKTGLRIKADNPNEVGADLVAGCVGAITKYKAPIILVDLGTASKVMAIDANKQFCGVVICPGVKTSARTLSRAASKLPEADLMLPEKVIGTNTFDCMNSGIINGHACMIDGLIRRFEKEMGTKCNRVVTGGLSSLITQAMEEEHVLDKNLLLEGLLAIYKKNLEAKSKCKKAK